MHNSADMAMVTRMLDGHVEKPSHKLQLASLKIFKCFNFTHNQALLLRRKPAQHFSAHVDAKLKGKPGGGRRPRSGVVVYYGCAAIHYQSSLQKCFKHH